MSDEHYVHDHGPAEGMGLRCPEYKINDKLYGFCVLKDTIALADTFLGLDPGEQHFKIMEYILRTKDIEAERDRWKDRWAATVKDADEQRHLNADLLMTLTELKPVEKPRVRVYLHNFDDMEFTD